MLCSFARLTLRAREEKVVGYSCVIVWWSLFGGCVKERRYT
jgi:hypothetical protein